MPFSPAQIADRLDDTIVALRGVAEDVLTDANRITITNVVTVLNDAQAALQAFSNSDTDQAGTVARIGADLSAVLTALSAMPLPPQAVLPVRIASLVVPMIVSAAQLIWPVQSYAANRMLMEVSTHAA